MFRSHRLMVVLLLAGLAVARVSGKQAPEARAIAGFDESTGQPTSNYTLYIGAADDGVPWTISGATSSDPDGNELSYRWICNGMKAGTAPNVSRLWPAGEHSCTLTVDDGSTTDSATATLRVRIDAQPPTVTAPDGSIVGATEAGGARSGDSSKLADWLNDATAVDNAGSVHSLPPLINGAPIGADTLFPLDVPTKVTFRFKDSYDNIGEDTAEVTVKDIQHGDLFVSTSRSFGSGAAFGVIKRVRNGVAEVFCESILNTSSPAYWGKPLDIIVDSTGRVVVLAPAPSGNTNFAHRVLVACDFKGDAGKVLAVYPGTGTPKAGLPVHFDKILFGTVNGLHLETVKTTVIDDRQNGGEPKTITQEVYVFSAHTHDRSTQDFLASKSFRYLSKTGTTEEGPEIVPISSPPPDMTNYNGDTYSAAKHMIGRTGHAFRVDVSGEVAGIDFGVSLRLGPALRSIGGPGRETGVNYLSDDLDREDFDSYPPCKGGNGITTMMPSPRGGPHLGFTGVDNIVVDQQFNGMVLTSPSHFSTQGYMTGVQQFWLDDDLLNDNLNRFTRYERNCEVQQSIGYRKLPAGVRKATNLVVGPDGLYGVYSLEEIIRIRPSASQDESLYLGQALGVAVWPPQKTEPSGTAIVVRINSPVNVMLMDATGKRLGVAADGSAVNDFGDAAMDSGPNTHPRFYVLRNPAAATYELRSVGTGDGPFAIQVYSSDVSKRKGHVATTRGSATLGAHGTHDFTLSGNGAVSFENSPPVANAGSDFTVDATSAEGARVTLNATASTDPDGGSLQYLWSGPFGLLKGAVVEAMLPRGVHALTLEVVDEHGASAEDVVAVTVLGGLDTTPPVLSSTRTPANVHGWNNSDVIVTFSCVDADSAIAVAPVSPVVISSEGGGQSASASCEDRAGNQATLAVDGINIDRTPPVIDGRQTPQANALGWNNSDVSVAFTCSDALAGVDGGTVSPQIMMTLEAANQAAAGSCRDRAGNDASTTVSGINIDKTAPVITGSADRQPNDAGWYNSAVTVQFVCSDALSGIAHCDSEPQAITTEGSGLAREGTAIDAAGNRATVAVSNINIDWTAPGVSCSTDPSSLWPPNHNMMPINVALTVLDTGSGPDGWLLTDVASDEDVGEVPVIEGWSIGTADAAGFLRAERNGGGDGRQYTLRYQGYDRAGNTALCSAIVEVPHDRRR